MKRAISLLLVLALCLSLCACKSKEVRNLESMIEALGEVTLESKAQLAQALKAYSDLSDEDKAQVENLALLAAAQERYETLYHQSLVDAFLARVCGEWYNVPEGDVYRLNPDGTGDHNGAVCSFTIDLDASTVTVAEGSASTRFTLSEEDGTAKLIPEGAAFYYVGFADYEVISRTIRQEATALLLSSEWWKAADDLNYISFTETGGGWCLMPGITAGLTWEFVDNNTIQVLVDYDGGQLLSLDVADAALTDTETGEVIYVPQE